MEERRKKKRRGRLKSRVLTDHPRLADKALPIRFQHGYAVSFLGVLGGVVFETHLAEEFGGRVSRKRSAEEPRKTNVMR